MAAVHLPDAFFDLVAHQLPPEPPRVGPQRGRPWVGHRLAVRVIWFVLTSGCRWEDVPPELGCSGRTAHRGRGRRRACRTACTPTCSGNSSGPAEANESDHTQLFPTLLDFPRVGDTPGRPKE